MPLREPATVPVLPRSFPPGAAECRPGDHLVRDEPDGSCRVYRVADIVAVERLVPGLASPLGLTAEADLLDSVMPAYLGEAYLLVDLLEPAFRNASEAETAIETGSLSVGLRGLLRPTSDYPVTTTLVVRRTPRPDLLA